MSVETRAIAIVICILAIWGIGKLSKWLDKNGY